MEKMRNRSKLRWIQIANVIYCDFTKLFFSVRFWKWPFRSKVHMSLSLLLDALQLLSETFFDQVVNFWVTRHSHFKGPLCICNKNKYVITTAGIRQRISCTFEWFFSQLDTTNRSWDIDIYLYDKMKISQFSI